MGARDRSPAKSSPKAQEVECTTHIHEPVISQLRFTTTDDAYGHNVYRDVAGEEEIRQFLEGSDHYNPSQRRWCIPEVVDSTDQLLGTVCEVISTIIRHFVKPGAPDVERNIINTNDIRLVSFNSDRERHKLPNLVVKAAGPSFETPSYASSNLASAAWYGSALYSNIASFAVVKTESELGTALENVGELENYAKRIFMAQPNRIYVRALVLTEKHARLFHFDHAGSQVTPLIDIHKNAQTLIRLAVGLSSSDEALLGLDSSVQWTIVDGKKGQGYLTTSCPTGEMVAYPIIEQIHTPRDTICSRATTCWRVYDPETSENYVVKDSWREDGLPAEHELLELVKNIPGVVHLVSSEPNRSETRHFRCASTGGQCQNRIASRVMLKAYGRSVECFSSILQFLYAFRDAIAAHQRLVQRGILHRDISLNNILLGRDGAPEGERGVLIDLDMAFRATDSKPTTKADYKIGTRLFQSIPVLQSCELKDRASDHDYLDDLEAFLYAFSFIVFCYRPDHSHVPIKEEGPSLVWSWAQEVPATARARKRPFFGAGTLVFRSLRLVQSAWGPACGDLFNKFRRWIFQMRNKKASLIGIGAATPGVDTNSLEPLHSCRDEHYATVIAMFDEAIDAVRSGPPRTLTPAESKQDTTIPPSTPGEGVSRQKHHPAGSGTAPFGSPVCPAPSSLPSNRKRRSTDVGRPEAPQTKARRPNESPTFSP